MTTINQEPTSPQDKVMLGITKAEFVKLPPVNQLVDLLPAKVYRFTVQETMQGPIYSLEYADMPKQPANFAVTSIFKRIAFCELTKLLRRT